MELVLLMLERRNPGLETTVAGYGYTNDTHVPKVLQKLTSKVSLVLSFMTRSMPQPP